MPNILLVGNFVQDHIVTPLSNSFALGGSVTYAGLALQKYSTTCISILTSIGQDLGEQNKYFIANNFSQCTICNLNANAPHTTAYKLVYDAQNCRKLFLEHQGSKIETSAVLHHINEAAYSFDAILFVPVADEMFDDAIPCIAKQVPATTILATDLQGWVRTFHGDKVVTLDAQSVRLRLSLFAKHVHILKAEYSEALVIFNDEQQISAKQCAIRLRDEYGIKIALVTMGKSGCYVAFESTAQYVPAYLPQQTLDETGAGDTFLSTLVAEYCHSKNVLHSVKMASAATSFRVEHKGPTGFATREAALGRVLQNQVIVADDKKLSLTVYE